MFALRDYYHKKHKNPFQKPNTSFNFQVIPEVYSETN